MSTIQLKQTLDRALQLHQAGKHSEAERQYRLVLSAVPTHADALHLLGLVLHQSGRHEPALAEIRKAIALRPSTAEYYVSLAAVHLALDQVPDAIVAGRRAVQLQPNLPEAWLNLGNALSADKQHEAAVGTHRRAISLRANYAQAYLGLGNALNELQRHDEAVIAYRQCLALNPKLADAHYNLGNSFRSLEQNELALASYRQAIAIKPDHLEAINNLACTMQQMGKLDAALACLIETRTAHPHRARVHSNIGNVLAEANRWDAAMECYQQALAVQDDFHDARFNLALAHLMQGDFQRGWPGYETRWKCKNFPSPPRYTDKPLWLGEPLNGRRLLLHAEQGMGDTLQFVRFVPLVAAMGGQIIFQVQTPLYRLLRNTPDITRCATVVARDLANHEFDLQCPLWSLPLALKTTMATIPPVMALSVDAEQSRRWRGRLDPTQLNVGLIWSGSPQFVHNYRRSTKLAKFAPLAKVPGITFISLQKGPAAVQAAQPPGGMRLIDWTHELNDFADTAALMSQLDLVISTDTGAAHLAATLGLPTWILLMFSPDFRWLRDRTDSPWYPSARLFRQPAAGDWDAVMERIAEALSVFKPV